MSFFENSSRLSIFESTITSQVVQFKCLFQKPSEKAAQAEAFGTWYSETFVPRPECLYASIKDPTRGTFATNMTVLRKGNQSLRQI
eukprot:scaffold2134_cov93-Cylindrotheca_fusiformis.AAC.16